MVAPELEALKRRYFKVHVDEPLIFHRKELVNRKYPFQALREPGVEESFNVDFLALLARLQYKVITAVIDKLEHRHRDAAWQRHPYHYCQAVLLERYVSSMGKSTGAARAGKLKAGAGSGSPEKQKTGPETGSRRRHPTFNLQV